MTVKPQVWRQIHKSQDPSPHPKPWKSLPGQLARQLFGENNGSWTKTTQQGSKYGEINAKQALTPLPKQKRKMVPNGKLKWETRMTKSGHHDQRTGYGCVSAKVGDQNHAECRLKKSPRTRGWVYRIYPPPRIPDQDYSFRLGNTLHLPLES